MTAVEINLDVFGYGKYGTSTLKYARSHRSHDQTRFTHSGLERGQIWGAMKPEEEGLSRFSRVSKDRVVGDWDFPRLFVILCVPRFPHAAASSPLLPAIPAHYFTKTTQFCSLAPWQSQNFHLGKKALGKSPILDLPCSFTSQTFETPWIIFVIPTPPSLCFAFYPSYIFHLLHTIVPSTLLSVPPQPVPLAPPRSLVCSTSCCLQRPIRTNLTCHLKTAQAWPPGCDWLHIVETATWYLVGQSTLSKGSS